MTSALDAQILARSASTKSLPHFATEVFAASEKFPGVTLYAVTKSLQMSLTEQRKIEVDRLALDFSLNQEQALSEAIKRVICI